MTFFPQGSFTIDQNTTPEQLARKREMIAAMMPQYGKAKYVGEGLGQLFTGIATGKKMKAMDEFEARKRQEASDAFGGMAGGPLSILGMRNDWGGNSTLPMENWGGERTEADKIGADTMAALGKLPGKEDVTAYIAEAAKARGIDPNVAVAVARSEGLNADPAEGWQSNYVKDGVREPSYGPFQLYMGGGLGNEFADSTGLDPRDPTTWQKQVDFALDYASKNGWSPWYGAQRVGIDNMQGIPGAASPAGGERVAQNTGQTNDAGPSIGELAAALSNPWLSREQKAIAQTMLEQRMQANDPLRQLQIEKSRIELEKLRNPKPKTTDDITEYNFAVENGYQGSFQDFMMDMKKAGATNVSTTLNTGDMPDARPIVDKPEKAFQRRWDPERQTWVDEAIPGSSAERDALEEQQAAEARQNAADTATDVVTTSAMRARDAAGKRDFGSAGTSLIGNLPWTDSAEVVRNVDALKSMAAAENLNQMRRQSKTGGALGNVTEKELKLLQDKSGALNVNSPTFLRDLDDYERTLLRTIHGVERGDSIFDQTRSEASFPDVSTMDAAQISDLMSERPSTNWTDDQRQAVAARLRELRGGR